MLETPQPVRFDTALRLPQAVSRLAAETEFSSWRLRFSEYMLGRVTPDSVSLRRVVPFFRNSWQPVFEGKFVETNGRTALVGLFGTSRLTRITMYIFVGFGTFWSCLALWSVSAHPDPNLPAWFPFCGFGMAALGLLMSRGFAWLSRGDVAWLTDKITNALRTSS